MNCVADVPGCYRSCPLDCERAAGRGECLNECWLEHRDQESCCPTCPNICKEQAKARVNYRNSTSGLDCAAFPDPTCSVCPQKCMDAAKRRDTISPVHIGQN